MADTTAKFESAQALFCAIADGVGSNNVDKVLNLHTYPTYAEFSEEGKGWGRKTNQDRISQAERYLDTTASLDEIEDFLNKNKSWYVSSVLIARKLIKFLDTEVDKDFAPLKKPGIDRYYFRGDRPIMGKIQELFTIANNNTNWAKLTGQTKFGDINKWSPADIYFASNRAKSKIATHQRNINEKRYNLDKLNTLINGLLDAGQLLPLSLKKQIKDVTIQPVNFDQDVKDKMINGAYENGKFVGGLWYNSHTNWKPYEPLDRWGHSPYEPKSKAIKDSAPTRDIRIFVSDSQRRNSTKGNIQMRHDATDGRGSWKVDFKYTGGFSRGGSVVSHQIFHDLLSFVNPTVAKAFLAAYIEGTDEYLKIMKTDWNGSGKGFSTFKKIIRDDHKPPYVTHINGRLPTVFTYKNEDPYSNLRGEISATTVINRVMPILVDWLNSKSANKVHENAGILTNEVDDFIRILFQYVTSRAPKSAKFVIAK